MSIIISILGFSFLVFIHELGHFLFARLTGMKVEKFSIGFGPAIYRFGKDTVYQIALFPFGGFVQIKGLTPETSSEPERPRPQNLEELERAWGAQGEVFAPVEDFDDAVKRSESGDAAPLAEEQLFIETEEERAQREAEELEGSFMSKSLWSRFLVVSGGPLFNVIFTFLVFGGMFAAHSAFNFKGHPATSLVIDEVDGAAARAGMLPGDVLLAVNDEPIKGFGVLRQRTIDSEGEALKITVARPPTPETRAFAKGDLHQECLDTLRAHNEKVKAQDPNAPQPKVKLRAISEEKIDEACNPQVGLILYRGVSEPDWERVDFTVKPENRAAEGERPRYRIGVTPARDRFGGEGLIGNSALAWGEVVYIVEMMSDKIMKGIRGEETVEVASVVKITAISADTVKRGNEWFLQFLAFLSLNLAFLNLLPFPALDGGRLIFLGIEALTRRPVPPRIEMMVHAFGILILLTLTVWVTAKDIFSLM